MKQGLPDGTAAGLKGANSSVGGCKPCKGSKVLAGEAGVCTGCDCKERIRKKNIIRNTPKSHSVCEWQLLTDGEVMSGGVDISPKISNWLIF